MPPDRASVLIYNDAGEYLLHLRDDVPGILEPGCWSFLGGGREPGDRSLEETARRELREEAGLDLSLVPFAVVGADDGDAAAVVQVFAGRWNGDPAALRLTEGVMLHWFVPEVLPRLRASASTVELVGRHAEQVRGSLVSRTAGSVPNIVGVHAYLENRDGRVLLGLRHPDSAFGGGMHHFLAGHCERESALACLVREAEEEAGLSIDPRDAEFVHAVHLLDAPGVQPRLQLVFRVRRWGGEPEVREPDRCLSWGWWDPRELPARTVPYTRAAIAAVAEGRLYSEAGWA
ncbi:NUDIX domain-containing protein [Actinomadura sp. NPDC048394]|uniref:NUDIX domain-containing protein n=1 Tax=Actinomadura sp. NPDC048394 TaxID=3158223 RepID=UPI0033F90C93